MKKLYAFGTGILALALASSSANAVLLSVSGPNSSLGAAPMIIAAPTQVLDAGVTNLGQEGFDERQNVVLGSNIATDQGTILAGTLVSSHMVFFNKIGTGQATHSNVRWTFGGTILGTMSDANGTREAASNSQLGSLTTIYPVAFSNRGLEGQDALTILGNQLDINLTMTVSQPGDWIRVVTTAVPEPGTIGLLGLGLLGLGATLRRRKA